jgi:hypothetical protein
MSQSFKNQERGKKKEVLVFLWLFVVKTLKLFSKSPVKQNEKQNQGETE